MECEIDLKGEICPYTFVKTKLKLEEMESGDILNIIIDYPESLTNVPRSLKNEGHTILEIKEISTKIWKIKVQKS